MANHAGPRVIVERARMAAILRLLSDEGHITPIGVRQIDAVLDDSEAADGG